MIVAPPLFTAVPVKIFVPPSTFSFGQFQSNCCRLSLFYIHSFPYFLPLTSVLSSFCTETKRSWCQDNTTFFISSITDAIIGEFLRINNDNSELLKATRGTFHINLRQSNKFAVFIEITSNISKTVLFSVELLIIK